MKIPSRPTTADSAARLKRFHELDAIATKSLADINAAATDYAEDELPPGFIGRDGFEAFIKSRGQSLDMTLTPADKDGLNVIILYLAAGGVVSRETILDVLTKFKPARNAEAVAT
jgi:hypothetical protein